MVRMRLLVMSVIGGLLLSAVGVTATPTPAERPAAAPVPFARALALTVQEITDGVAALHKALPPLAPRLEPIEAILKALRAAIREDEEIEPKDVHVELLKLDLHLHRLLFDLEQGAREMVQLRDTVKQFVDRFTARMDPRMAQQFREFAQGLLEIVQERAGERRPETEDRDQLARIVGKLKVDVNRLDLLLLRSLDAVPAGK